MADSRPAIGRTPSADLRKHINMSLQALYNALDDVEQERIAIIKSINILTDAFQSSVPQSDNRPELPVVNQDERPRTLSQYPEGLGNKPDYDITDLEVNFYGAVGIAESVERIAKAAHLANKTLRCPNVADFLKRTTPPGVDIACNVRAVRNTISNRPHLYKRLERGVFTYHSSGGSDAR